MNHNLTKHPYRLGLLVILLFGMFSVPLQAQKEENPILSFSVLSDIHISTSDPESSAQLQQALTDHHHINPHRQLMVMNGDLTNGIPSDYVELQRILDSNPHPPIHATMGNHEYYGMWVHPNGKVNYKKLAPQWSSQQAIQLFLRHFPNEQPYHELNMEGYLFLFLSGEAYRDVSPDVQENAYLSKKQLRWLRDRIETHTAQNRHHPIFVFLHQPLPHTVDGSDLERGVVQGDSLRKLLEAYPEIIYFSGHTHEDLETTKQTVAPSYLAVGSSSVRSVWENGLQPEHSAKSQSLCVDVYRDKVIIRGREHSTKQWIGQPYIHTFASGSRS